MIPLLVSNPPVLILLGLVICIAIVAFEMRESLKPAFCAQCQHCRERRAKDLEEAEKRRQAKRERKAHRLSSKGKEPPKPGGWAV